MCPIGMDFLVYDLEEIKKSIPLPIFPWGRISFFLGNSAISHLSILDHIRSEDF